MSFRKGLKSVTQSGLERGSRYLRQYGTRCNIGLEKDDPYDHYNSVESSSSVATESSSYTSLCTENDRAISSSSQSRRAVDRQRCNSKSRDREKDHRKKETLVSAALGANMLSNKCHGSSNSPNSQYKKLNCESNEFNSKSNYLEAHDESMSSVGMDTLTVENTGFSHPKSFKQNKEIHKNDSLKRQKTLEFLEKLLKNCDPEIEEQLKKLVKEKFGPHLKTSHQKEVLSSNQTVNDIMELLEQQKSDSFVSCNSSRLSSLSSRSKNDWSKLRAENNRNLVKSTKSFLSKNRVTEGTSFVLDGTNLNEDLDEGVFLHGENYSDNKLARNCSTNNISETKSHKDFLNSPQHDMWDTIHQVLNEQQLENEFWQKTTSMKNNFETKLPNLMDKSSTEDSTIKNILKSIGFDTEMCKRMQECAKQVSGKNDQLRCHKDKQLTNKSKHSLSPEIDKSGLKRGKNKILSSEKASHKTPCKNFIATVPPIDTSVPPPIANFSNTITPPPPLAPPPLPMFHSRPPIHPVLPPGLPPHVVPANYNHVPPRPAIAPPCGPFLSQPQTSNLFPQQYSFNNMFDRNSYYNISRPIIPTSIPPPPLHSNLKVIPLSTLPTSNPSIPSATTPSSLPGSSLYRDNSSKTDSWLSNNERSSQWNLLSPSHRDRSPMSSRRDRSLTPCSSRHTSHTLRRERSQGSSSSKRDKSRSPPSLRRGRSRTPSSSRRDRSRDRSQTPSKSRRKKSRNQKKRDRSRTPYSSRRSYSRSPCSMKRDRPRSPVSRRGSRYSKSSSRHSRSPTKPSKSHTKKSRLLHHANEKFTSEYEHSPSPPVQKRTGSPVRCNGSTEGKNNNASSLKVQDVKEIFALKSKNLNSSTNNSNRKYYCFLPHEIEQIIKQRILCSNRLETLQNELAMLRKQQNELMRKKQREKDGHKDPILIENAALQEEVSDQVKLLKKSVEELTETLEISGMSMESFTYHEKFYQYSKKSSLSDQFGFKSKSQETRDNEKKRKTNKFHSHGFDKTASIQKETSCERFSQDNEPFLPLEIKSFAKGRQSNDKEKFAWNKRMDNCQLYEDKDKKTSSFPLKWSSYSSENFLHNLHENKEMAVDCDETRTNKDEVSYEYFDPGNHWCRHCNLVTGNIYELFQHLQSKKHKAKLDHYDRPWLPESIKNPSNKPKMGQVQMAPIKGVEFLMSTHAFYCTLCKEFSGDVLCAEAHLKSDSHNTTYQKHILENPFYEKRLNLDKAAGLQFFTSDKGEKRKNTEDSDNEEKKDSFKKVQHDSKRFSEENKETVVLSKDLMKDTKTNSKQSTELSSEEIQKEILENNRNKNAGVSPNCEDELNETKVTVVEENSVKDKILDQAKPTVQRSKIAIKLTGKTGIKPLPVLPPSIPVGKMPGRHKKKSAKAGSGKKMWPTKEVENQLSLDDFLTCSNNHGSVPVVSDIETDIGKSNIKITNLNISGQSSDNSYPQDSVGNIESKESFQKFLPESHMSTTTPASVTQISGSCLLPIDVLAAPPPPPPPPPPPSSVSTCKNSNNVFQNTESSDMCSFPVVDQRSINVHDLNKESKTKGISENKNGARALLNQPDSGTQMPTSTGVNTKSEEFSAEDLDDMRLLGIDPASQVPMAEVRPPPSLLSLTAHNMTNGGHEVKSKPTKDKSCVASSQNISFVDNSIRHERDGKQPEPEKVYVSLENKEQSPDESSQHCSDTEQHTLEDKSGLDEADIQFFTSDKRKKRENNEDSDNEEKDSFKKVQHDSKERFSEEYKEAEVLSKTDSERSTENSSEEIQKENLVNNSNKNAGVSPNSEDEQNETKVTVVEENSVKDKILDQTKPTVQRSKITIKLTGKTGIKPLQYPVLSPWLPASKMPCPNKGQSTKAGSGKKVLPTKEVENQLSLDDFLTCSNNHGSVPVVSDIETDVEKTDIKITNLDISGQSSDNSSPQDSVGNIESKESFQKFLPESHMSTTTPASVSQISGSCLLPIDVLAAPCPPPTASVNTCKDSSNVFEYTESTDNCSFPVVDQRSINAPELNKESETNGISENKNGASDLLNQPDSGTQMPTSTSIDSKSEEFSAEDLDDMKLLGIDSASPVPLAEIHLPPPPSSSAVFQITEINNESSCQTNKDNNNTLHPSVTLEVNPSYESPPDIQETPLLVSKKQFSEICNNNVSDPSTSSASILFDELNSKVCYSISSLPSEIPEALYSNVKLPSVPNKLQLSDNFELPAIHSAMDVTSSNLCTITSEKMESDSSAVSSKSVSESNCLENKDGCTLVTLLSNGARSDLRTVDSSTVEQNSSLIPLPTTMNSSLDNIWDIPLPSNLQSHCQPPPHSVLIRESEHNYAIRLMENSDGVMHPVKRVPLQHDNEEDDVDSDDSNNDVSNNSWKTQSFMAQSYLSHNRSDDEEETSQLSMSSENDSNNSLPQQCSQSSESNDTISPPFLVAEGRQSCVIPNEDLDNNDSPPPLTAEVPCLSHSVSLPCSTSSVIPVTLICTPTCESKTLLTTPNTLSIDSTSVLNNMSILNLDSVIRNQANSVNHTPKSYTSNDKNAKNIKKVVLLKKTAQNIPSRHLRISRKSSRTKQNDLKLLKLDKVEQEKIIVKVTSRTSEGVPVISLTPATSTASYTTSDLSSPSVATTSSSGSNFTEISETETADSSLLEAAAKKAETLPKMFMPTVVLHDIKYTMGKDLSPMTTIPSSIENIPIFDSENDDSDTDVKFESPKKSFDSQRHLEIESPSKSTEAFDPYMFLNRPTKPSIPSSSSNSTQLTNENSTLFSIGPGGTSATGRVTADSLPSIDHQSMVSSMFDVTDCKFAFPDVFLENGEPETPLKMSDVDVLGPGLPFETSSKSNIALGLDILNEFYTAGGTEDSS